MPTDDAAAGSDELVVDHSYVQKKLEHGLTRIWQVCREKSMSLFLFLFKKRKCFFLFFYSLHKPPCHTYIFLQDVQLKVKAYILGTDMSNFKYDDFIVVLDVISRYRGAGSFLVSYKYRHSFSISVILLSFFHSWSTFTCSCFLVVLIS